MHSIVLRDMNVAVRFVPCTVIFLSRLPPRGAHIENQPTGYEEALSQLSGPGPDTGHLLECRNDGSFWCRHVLWPDGPAEEVQPC